MTESLHPSEQALDALAAVHTHLVIDEATTGCIRGWAFNRATPVVPAVLRFLLAGQTVRQGACEDARPGVQRAGYPTGRVGFSFTPSLRRWSGTLTVEDDSGASLPMSSKRRPVSPCNLLRKATRQIWPSRPQPDSRRPIKSALQASTTHAAFVRAANARPLAGWTRNESSEQAPTGGRMSRFGLGGLLRGGKARTV